MTCEILIKIFKTFRGIGIFPNSEMKLRSLCNKYEKGNYINVKTLIGINNYYIYKDGFYPYLIMELYFEDNMRIVKYFNFYKNLHNIGNPAIIKYQLIDNEWKVKNEKFYENGNLTMTIKYHDNSEKMTEKYYKDGKLHREKEYPSIIEYFKSGEIMCKKYYKDGKLHRNGDKAAIIWYYISHKIEFEIYYKDGIMKKIDNNSFFPFNIWKYFE